MMHTPIKGNKSFVLKPDQEPNQSYTYFPFYLILYTGHFCSQSTVSPRFYRKKMGSGWVNYKLNVATPTLQIKRRPNHDK
jgi:hypothetical protein